MSYNLYLHIAAVIEYEWSVSVPLRRLCHHGAPPLEAPGHLPDSPSGPDEPVKSDLLLTSSLCLQVPLHPHHSPPQPAPVTGQASLRPAPLARLLCSVWAVSAGTVSASSLRPALCRDENQVCPEEALQRLFHCSAERASVCVLQDKSEAQAEAGLKCWRGVVKIGFEVVDI